MHAVSGVSGALCCNTVAGYSSAWVVLKRWRSMRLRLAEGMQCIMRQQAAMVKLVVGLQEQRILLLCLSPLPAQ